MKLDIKKTLKVGTAFAIIMAFWAAYDYVIPLLIDNAYGLNNSMRGLVMGLDNFLSLFMIPLFGKLSDKTVSKLGKRTPYVLIGTIATIILMVLVPVTSQSQLSKSMQLKEEVTNTFAENYTYTDFDNQTYTAKELYTYLYQKGYENADFCDHDFLAANNIDSLDRYLEIALNGKDADGKLTAEYNRFVATGIQAYASQQVYQKITAQNPTSIIVFIIVLFFVIATMTTFRSPAIAIMPDMTPKPLRSQANSFISLMGGVGAALAFLIYTIVLSINPVAYILVFVLTAVVMGLLLLAFVMLVKEKQFAAECEKLCLENNISNDDDDIVVDHDGTTLDQNSPEVKKLKKEKKIALVLILSSVCAWFLGYCAVTTNLSIYITKTLNLDAGLGGLVVGISMGISAVAFIPVGYMAAKIGRKKTIIIGFIMSIVSFTLIFFFAANPKKMVFVIFTALYLIAGFGSIIANVNTFPMVVELSSRNNIGKYTGYYYFASMAGQAIAPFIAGLLMDALGSKFLFLYAVVCVAIAILLIAFVKHGDSSYFSFRKKKSKQKKTIKSSM